VGATYEQGAAVELTFDVSINVDAFDPVSLTLFDGPAGFQYVGTDAFEMVSPTTLRVPIIGTEEWTGAGVTMSVTNASGIVAVTDGAEWAGASALNLPFP
jgi:hypothetical protein